MWKRVLWLGVGVALGACSDDEAGGRDGTGQRCEETVGRWELGDDNLFMEVTDGCAISNFCSIREGIHTRGTVTDGELRLDSVGGRPLVFAYTLAVDTLTIVDGSEEVDLPLRRRTQALPATCPPLP